MYDIYLFAVDYSPRRTRWVGHVARMGRGEVHTGLWWGNLRERDNPEDPDVDRRMY